jgi:hypothetical protein
LMDSVYADSFETSVDSVGSAVKLKTYSAPICCSTSRRRIYIILQ